MPSAPCLTLCMIVRDERTRLPACLESVRGLADEIVVVDTGSTDGTPDVARAAGARVHETPWPHDFSAARNAGLELATGRWILVLDADETLPAASREALRAIVAGPADHARALVQRNLLPESAGHISVSIVRLFPRHPRVRFERPIHEQVNTALEREGIRIVDTDIPFLHTGYASAAAMPAKTRRNRALIEAALAREPDADPNLWFFHAASFFDTGEHLRAAELYDECARRSAGRRRRLEVAARIKQAESLWLAGRPAEAEVCLPAGADSPHPLVCELRAALADLAGRRDEAKGWRERLLSCPDVAHLPPVALGPMKLRALNALAEDWAARGRKDRAVKVLRLGLAAAQGRIDAAAAAIGQAYATA